MLNKIQSIILILFLSINLTLCAVCEEEIPIERSAALNNEQTELVQESVNVKDLDIEPINTQKVKDTVIPDPQKEGKKVIGLFLKTMMAVALCAVLLYVILLFVKRFYSGSFSDEEMKDLENYNLATPNNKQDALKSFLNRTK